MIYHIKGAFDAAHALIHHEGRCRHLHGHTYKAIAHLEIADADVFGNTETSLNMPIDFARMKGVLDAILGARDHCLLLSLAGKAKFFSGHEPGTKMRLTEGEPTAEYLARDIYRALSKDMPRLRGQGPEIMLVAVTLWETDRQGVTFAPSCQPRAALSVSGVAEDATC